MTATFAAIAGILVFMAFVFCYVGQEGSTALASMGYNMGDCGFNASGPAYDITYTSGLPGKPANTRRRVAAGSSMI